MRIPSILAATVLLISVLPAQRPKPCQFTRIDPTCGPVLTGSDMILATTSTIFHSFRINVTGAPASAPGVLAFSLKQAKIPLGKCTLLIDPTAMLILPFNANAGGAAQVRFTIKGALKGTVFAQSAHDKLGTPLLSNGQQITCL